MSMSYFDLARYVQNEALCCDGERVFCTDDGKTLYQCEHNHRYHVGHKIVCASSRAGHVMLSCQDCLETIYAVQGFDIDSDIEGVVVRRIIYRDDKNTYISRWFLGDTMNPGCGQSCDEMWSNILYRFCNVDSFEDFCDAVKRAMNCYHGLHEHSYTAAKILSDEADIDMADADEVYLIEKGRSPVLYFAKGFACGDMVDYEDTEMKMMRQGKITEIIISFGRDTYLYRINGKLTRHQSISGKKSWEITDNSCLQCRDTIPWTSDNQYEFWQIEDLRQTGSGYALSHMIVDLYRCSTDELRAAAAGFDDDIDDFMKSYDKSTEGKALMAEYVFETSSMRHISYTQLSWNQAVKRLADTTGLELSGYLRPGDET